MPGCAAPRAGSRMPRCSTPRSSPRRRASRRREATGSSRPTARRSRTTTCESSPRTSRAASSTRRSARCSTITSTSGPRTARWRGRRAPGRAGGGTGRVNATLFLEQTLNGVQFGLMLFLLAAGLTLIFGIMDMINLAHGSLYMIGAYLMASLVQATGSFWLALPLALAATALVGAALEIALLRRLYERDHLTQVLATFAIILIANEAVRIIWGSQPILLNTPPELSGPVQLPGGMQYASYRLVIIAVGAAVALLLYLLVTRTRI